MTLRLHAFTDRNRHEVTQDLVDAIAEGGGWLLESRLHSNKMLVLHFGVEAAGEGMLAGALARSDAGWDAESRAALAAAVAGPGTGRGGDVTGSLTVTFRHDEPDLSIEVPAVPG